MENKILKNVNINFKENLILSKRYWMIYIILILFASLSIMTFDNFIQPQMEIFVIVLFSLLGIFIIIFHNGHDKELYKTTFIIILTVGIICSFLTPICFVPDEIEHFVRSDMTARGNLFPVSEDGSFLTIQSIIDLIEVGRFANPSNYTGMCIENSSIFDTDADTLPINNTLVSYHSAFIQNPFWGYIAQAFGICLAKLLNLNAIWLLWLGRIFNTILYASLVTWAIKKTPILKIPLMIFACMPLSIYLCASLSIDSFINGMGILSISYFFYLYKSPKNSLSNTHILKFSSLVLLLGTCKATYFGFILLLLCIPRSNFKKNKFYYCIFSVILFVIIAILWSKFYMNPGFFESWRINYITNLNVNPTEQIGYMLSHKNETILELLKIPNYFNSDLRFSYNNGFKLWDNFRSIYLMFLGSVILLYPHEKYNIKSKIGTLFVIFIEYFGTYLTLLITWNTAGKLEKIVGIQPRYFLPIMGLLPFIFGFNHTNINKQDIDYYLVVLMLFFLVMMPISMVVTVY